jgi:hypothetical protein
LSADAGHTTATVSYGLPPGRGRKRFVSGVELICEQNGVSCSWTLERELVVFPKVVFRLTGEALNVRAATNAIAEWSVAFQGEPPAAAGG